MFEASAACRSDSVRLWKMRTKAKYMTDCVDSSEINQYVPLSNRMMMFECGVSSLGGFSISVASTSAVSSAISIFPSLSKSHRAHKPSKSSLLHLRPSISMARRNSRSSIAPSPFSSQIPNNR